MDKFNRLTRGRRWSKRQCGRWSAAQYRYDKTAFI